MIVVRPAEGEQDYRKILALLALQFAEVGRGAVNPGKAGAYVYRVMTEGAAYIVERDGAAVATVGLSMLDFWYSDSRFWTEEWLFIMPEHRDGAVLRAVFRELKVLGEETGLPVSITVFNAKRASGQTEIHVEAERFFFRPGGLNVIIEPVGGKSR